MLACPVCHGALRLEAGRVLCLSCGRKYPIEDGIPILLAERAQSS
ncbi:Trm112 family protein [Acidobacterium sp. S8]